MADTAVLNLPETPVNKPAKKPAKKGKAKPAPVKLETRGIPQQVNTVAAEGYKAVKAASKWAAFGRTMSGATKGTIKGYSITSVVRAVGKAGADVRGVIRMLVRLGLPSKMGMVRAQTGDGHRLAAGLEPFHGQPAPLTKTELAELLKLCDE